MNDDAKHDRQRRIYIQVRLEELKLERDRLQEERKALLAKAPPPQLSTQDE